MALLPKSPDVMNPIEHSLLAGLLLCCAVFPAAAQDSQESEPPLSDSSEYVETAETISEQTAGELQPSTGFLNQAYKVGYSLRPLFGGPNSPQGQLEEGDRLKEPAFRLPQVYETFEGWRDWKRGMNEDHGFQFSGHYSSLYQKASDSLEGGEDTAASGVLRGTARWELFNRGEANTGALVLMVDHRHSYTDVPPASLANEIGYVGVTGTLYSDIDLKVVNFNWQQALNDGNSGLMIGRYDPSDYMNILGTTNPWALFSNVSTLLDSSVSYGDASWGIAGGSWFDEQWYFTAGLNDANGSIADNMEFFDGGAEFYKWFEFGWSPGKDNRYFKNFHITTWHVDAREDIGYSSGKGVMLAGNWMYNDNFMPYVRAGWSDGAEENKIYDRSATVGFIYKYYARSDVGGLAINWGRIPKKTLANSPTQTTVEAFWRLQFAQNLEITPSLQYLLDPALNEGVKDIWIYGLRARLTF
jgi:porin